jgi:hypothetical protein
LAVEGRYIKRFVVASPEPLMERTKQERWSKQIATGSRVVEEKEDRINKQKEVNKRRIESINSGAGEEKN